MRARGVEPPRPLGHKDLNLARLPVPPRSRIVLRLVSFFLLEQKYVSLFK